jgi:hypothetical protein
LPGAALVFGSRQLLIVAGAARSPSGFCSAPQRGDKLRPVVARAGQTEEGRVADCVVCETENGDEALWCKECKATLPYFGKMQDYYQRQFDAPKVARREEPFKAVGLKRMQKMPTTAAAHAEARVRVQFRVLHVYAWMLERGIIEVTNLVMWGAAPLQQGKAGGGNEAAHQILASLLFSADDGKSWKYLYQAPLLSTCSQTVQTRVRLVLGALHAQVSNVDKSFNDTDFVIELAIRPLILRFVDEIRGIFIANEYTSKTWPGLWYAFRDEYVNLCISLSSPAFAAKWEHKERKVDKDALELYIEVARGLGYERLSTVQQGFKDIVNLSEGPTSWS